MRAAVRRRWALTAVPGAALVGVLAWPSVQGAPPVVPTEVPARVERPPAAEPARVAARPAPPRTVVRQQPPATRPVPAVAPAAPRPLAPPPAPVPPEEPVTPEEEAVDGLPLPCTDRLPVDLPC